MERLHYKQLTRNDTVHAVQELEAIEQESPSLWREMHAAQELLTDFLAQRT